jgi:hypothetical protein
MSLPPCATGVLSRGLPLLHSLGSREELHQAFGRESDPQARATVLRTLIAMEVGERRSGADAAGFAKFLESCAADCLESDVVREAAAIGLPFVSMDRAEAVLPELLESSPPVRARAIDLLEAITFLEKASAATVPVGLRAILVKHVGVRIADPATSPEERRRGEVLLSLQVR